MNIGDFSLWILLLGFLGLIFKKNFFNILSSLLQLNLGIVLFLSVFFQKNTEINYILFLILILSFLIIIHGIALGVLLVNKQSSINVNELSELNG